MAIDLDTIFKLSLAKKVALLLVVFVAASYAFYTLDYAPKREELKNLEARLTDAQKKLKESKDAARRLPEFRKEVEKLNEKFKGALTRLPDKKEIPSLLESVSFTGRESNLEFLLFRPLAIVSKGFYAEVPVEVKVEGSYHDLAQFFQKVGNMPRIVNISSLKITNAKDVKGEIVLTAGFLTTTFMFLGKEDGSGDKK